MKNLEMIMFLCYLFLCVNAVNIEKLISYNKKEQINLTNRIKEVNGHFTSMIPKAKTEISKIEAFKSNINTLNAKIEELKQQFLYQNQKLSKIKSIYNAIESQNEIIRSVTSKINSIKQKSNIASDTKMNSYQGINAKFYGDELFQNLQNENIFSKIQFFWDISPINSISSQFDNFSVKLTGYLRSPYSGYYSFKTESDNNEDIELLINNEKAIGGFIDKIYLNGNEYNPISLKYFHSEHSNIENKKSYLSLLWKFKDEKKFNVIPSDFFFVSLPKNILKVSLINTDNLYQVQNETVYVNEGKYAIKDLSNKYIGNQMIFISNDYINANEGKIKFYINSKATIRIGIKSSSNSKSLIMDNFNNKYDLFSVIDLNKYSVKGNRSIETNTDVMKYEIYQKNYDAGAVEININYKNNKSKSPIFVFVQQREDKEILNCSGITQKIITKSNILNVTNEIYLENVYELREIRIKNTNIKQLSIRYQGEKKDEKYSLETRLGINPINIIPRKTSTIIITIIEKYDDKSPSTASFELYGSKCTEKTDGLIEKKEIYLKCRDSIINNNKFESFFLSVGKEIQVNCLESCADEDYDIYGGENGYYSIDSSICKSAYHSGKLDNEGGIVKLIIGNSIEKLRGIKQKGIKSYNKDYADITMKFEKIINDTK